MSEGNKSGFFQTDNDFIDSGCFAALAKYSKPAAIIFTVLLRYRHNKTNMAFPSFDELVELSGMCAFTVSKSTRILNDFHLIDKKRGSKRFKFHNHYKIRRYDRKGYEQVARILSTALNKSKPKRVLSTALKEGHNKFLAGKERVHSTPLKESKKAPCVHSTPLNPGIHSTPLKDKDLKRLKKTIIKKEENSQTFPSKNQNTKSQKKPKITAAKLSAEFDKTKDAGEKAFQSFTESLQPKSKSPPANKTIDGVKTP